MSGLTGRLLLVVLVVVPISAAFVVAGSRAGLPVAFAVTALVAYLAIRAVPEERLERARSEDGRHRLLLVGDERIGEPGVAEEVLARAPSAEVRVVAPLLTGWLDRWASATDDAAGQACGRVDRLVAVLREHGVEAGGGLGDEDPFQAVADALRTFAADEVMLVTSAAGRSQWADEGLAERIRARLDVPVTHLVPASRGPATGGGVDAGGSA